MPELICGSDDCRVIVDKKARTVTFEHCHRLRAWWAFRVSEHFVCSVDDVIAIHFFRPDIRSSEYSGIAIVTKHGRALLSKKMAGYEGVIRFLMTECHGRGPGPWYENPNWTPLIVVVLLVLSFAGFAAFLRLWK